MSSEKEFKINEYFSLKLEGGVTNIYVVGKRFDQCKYLLLNIPKHEIEEWNKFDSIDEVSESLDHSLEGYEVYEYEIPPETEFWAHCSNLQAWAENNYDTRIINYVRKNFIFNIKIRYLFLTKF